MSEENDMHFFALWMEFPKERVYSSIAKLRLHHDFGLRAGKGWGGGGSKVQTVKKIGPSQ
jgi:hypothetical protein